MGALGPPLSLLAEASCLDENLQRLNKRSQKVPRSLSLNLYSRFLAVIQIINKNHTKLGPTLSLSFCSQPTFPVVGTGLGWEAGVTNATGRK